VDVDGHPRIVFPDKLVGDVLAAYQTRFRLHHAVYQHKVVKAIELMIVDALIAADRAGVFSFRGSDKRDYSLSRCVDDPTAFCLAQDDVLQQIRSSRSIEALGARNLIKRLDTRQLYRSVGEVSIRRPNHYWYNEPYSAGGSELLTDEMENPNTLTQIENQNTELYKLYDQPEDVIKRMLLETDPAKSIELSESDVIVEKMRVHHGSYGNDPVQSVYFYSKSDLNRARKLGRTKYENLCPATFMKEAIRVFCTSTSANVITIVHEAFKELTKTKPFLAAKGTPLITGGDESPWDEDEDDEDGESDEEEPGKVVDLRLE
jgi:HD superfamily phosphohydrolase